MFLAFVPLTPSGMFLQIWPEKNQPGVVVFVPYQTVLLVPADTVHGGGFLSCPVTHNLRLHFYIYINDYANKTQKPASEYFDDTRYPGLYPQSQALTNGLLDKFFEIAKIEKEPLNKGEETKAAFKEGHSVTNNEIQHSLLLRWPSVCSL